MSNYYEYQDVKVAIVRELFKRGWNVYGYHEDNSDSMTDYYDPESWDGVAEKNGYILCVDVYGAAEPQEIRQFVNASAVDNSIHDKIEKLSNMTVERGATEGEARNAAAMLETLQKKLDEQQEEAKKYNVTGIIPGHMENPPRCNWHLEKDGIYILKGNGILKYSSISDYYKYPQYSEDMKKYQQNAEKWEKETAEYLYCRGSYDTPERCVEIAAYRAKEMKEKAAIIESFLKWISKIDNTAGCLIGNEDETVTYETVKTTKYKNEVHAEPTKNGSFKDGQCFMVMQSVFNNGIYKGLVYRIHVHEWEDGKPSYYAQKLNGKLTKECTGMAMSNNHWFIGEDTTRFEEWINKGLLSWVNLQEVRTPYEVEKVVKKVVKNTPKAAENENQPEHTEGNKSGNNYTFDIKEDTDTRDGSKLWVVRCVDSLERAAYIELSKHIKTLGGYYSKFKHGFIFRTNPAAILQ